MDTPHHLQALDDRSARADRMLPATSPPTRGRSRRTRARMGALVVAGALLVPGAVTVAAATAGASAACTPVARAVRGGWENPDPLQLVSVEPEGSALRIHATSHTIWHGDLEGTTEFSMSILFDPVAGTSTGTIDETFTGSVTGIGSGTLRFAETVSIAADGSLVLDARPVSGTGALRAVRGHLHFVGHSDEAGVGSGSYDGRLAAVPGRSA